MQQTAQQPATTSTSAPSGLTRDPPPHLTTGLLCAVFPETPAILDVDPSVFLMTVTPATNYPPMPVIEDVEFQPYIAQAWAAFQVDRALKDKDKKYLCFNGVKIPSCKALIWSHAKLLYQKRWRFFHQSSNKQLRLHQLQCQRQPQISLLELVPGLVLHSFLLHLFLHQCPPQLVLVNPDSCPLNLCHHLPNPGRLVPFLLMFLQLINHLSPLHSISIHYPWRTKLHLGKFWIRYWALISWCP